ncbi:unnamed protein product [Closterium sp. NIES-64]|nr:unnamed protein product [Closterium sp. NIES-64]
MSVFYMRSLIDLYRYPVFVSLYIRAIQHYTNLSDIKRVIINTHAIEPQSLVEFFGTLSKEWALDCMKELLLVNMRGNLQISVQVAKEFAEQLGMDNCVKR